MDAIDPPLSSNALEWLGSLGLRSWPEASAASSEWRRAWGRLLGGEFEEARRLAIPLEDEAFLAGDAEGVVEAAAMQALAASLVGDLEAATSVARRASRMGRTEALPEAEYLANIVLARVRRLTGRPHLAARILRSLREVVPCAWRAWLDWETELAAAAVAGITPSRVFPTVELRAVLAAARHGASDLPVHLAALEERATGAPLVASDVSAVVDLLDQARTPRSSAVRAWRDGSSALTPPELHGIISLAGDSPADDTALAYIYATPARPAVRVPRIAWRVIDDPTVHALAQGHRRQGRSETMISALLCAGRSGIAKPALFEETYGFAFDPPRHENVFHVAVHRARAWLGERGTVQVIDERVWLQLAAAVLVPDPRCSEDLEHRLLRAVAATPRIAATEVAAMLGLSVRVVQRALKALAEDGVCEAEISGRKVLYVVEDTTFREPTRA